MLRILALTLWLSCSWQALADSTLTGLEAQIVALSNRERSRVGLPALTAASELADVARGHSEEMARLNYFEHESPTPGRTEPWDRANLAGIDSAEFGENIFLAEGHAPVKVPNLAVTAWMHSPGHRANLLSPAFNHVGIGLAVFKKQIYVTQLFSAELEPYKKP